MGPNEIPAKLIKLIIDDQIDKIVDQIKKCTFNNTISLEMYFKSGKHLLYSHTKTISLKYIIEKQTKINNFKQNTNHLKKLSLIQNNFSLANSHLNCKPY